MLLTFSIDTPLTIKKKKKLHEASKHMFHVNFTTSYKLCSQTGSTWLLGKEKRGNRVIEDYTSQ